MLFKIRLGQFPTEAVDRLFMNSHPSDYTVQYAENEMWKHVIMQKHSQYIVYQLLSRKITHKGQDEMEKNIIHLILLRFYVTFILPYKGAKIP